MQFDDFCCLLLLSLLLQCVFFFDSWSFFCMRFRFFVCTLIIAVVFKKQEKYVSNVERTSTYTFDSVYNQKFSSFLCFFFDFPFDFFYILKCFEYRLIHTNRISIEALLFFCCCCWFLSFICATVCVCLLRP